MQWVSRAAAAGFALILIGAAGCQSGELRGGAEPPAPTTIVWREIGRWSGGLSRQTESFEVSTAAMRLHWRVASETTPGAGRLTVTLHSAVSGRPLQTLVDARGTGSATIDVADEPRWSYLVIDAVDVEWTLTLEQGFASVSPTAAPRR